MENEFITLSCPSCGGKLDVNPKMEYLFCSYCGQKQMLRHHDGAVSLAPVLEVMEGVKSGVDKTASELAIVRLQKEIDEIEDEKEDLIDEYPEPTTNVLFIVFFIVGILGIVGAINAFIGNVSSGISSSGTCLLVIGLIFGGLGAGMIFVITPRKKQEWKKTTVMQLAALDTQFNEKQAELEHYRNLVALH